MCTSPPDHCLTSLRCATRILRSRLHNINLFLLRAHAPLKSSTMIHPFKLKLNKNSQNAWHSQQAHAQCSHRTVCRFQNSSIYVFQHYRVTLLQWSRSYAFPTARQPKASQFTFFAPSLQQLLLTVSAMLPGRQCSMASSPSRIGLAKALCHSSHLS